MNLIKFFVLCYAFTTSVFAREIEIENFQPDVRIKSDDFVDYGTLRVTKVKKNHFSLSGEFEIKMNCGNEKMVCLQVLLCITI
jgi:hypothetical protein